MNTTARLDIAADWLQRLQTSPSDEALVTQWTEWCRQDPQNLAAFEQIEAVWGALDTPKIRSLLQSPPQRTRIASRPAIATLAAGVMLAAITAFVLMRTGDGTVLSTKIAEHDSRTLADGSHVDLGAKTQIVARYTDTERKISVQSGEAFFEVAKDSRRPFIVDSGKIRITALGTAFSVRQLSDRTFVTVTEGKVSVSSLPGLRGGKPKDARTLSPGQQSLFDEADGAFKLANVDPRNAIAWRNGILKFVNEPLSSVVEDINRYSPRPIRLDDPRLRERLYTGTMYPGRDEHWLHALEEVFPLQAVDRGDEIVLQVR